MPITAECENCGNSITGIPDSNSGTKIPCPRCSSPVSVLAPLRRIRAATAPAEPRPIVPAAVREAAHTIIVTTTHSVDGFRIVAYLGVESAEVVMGSGPLSEMTTGLQDMVGTRATSFEKKMKAAKDEAFQALKLRAAEMGGNAIVGVSLSHAPFEGNRMAVVVSGTVVKVNRTKIADQSNH